MKITYEMIDEQLRTRAEASGLGSKINSAEVFRIAMTQANKMYQFEKPTDIQYIEKWIPRKKDGSKMRIVIFKPLKPVEEAPGVFWIHGGAFAAGAPEQVLEIVRLLIQASNSIIVSPDYRLSLEAPYPAPLDDCYEALLWMKEHTEELGIRDNQIIVGGDSAGGSLAVSASLLARDRGDVNIAFQMPLYPALDDRMMTESMKDNNSPLVDSTLLKFTWQFYLGELFGKDVPVYAAPAREKDYSGLPPAIMYVGGVDPLRDDAVHYAEGLKKAGVSVHFKVFDGGFHGFEFFCPEAEISKTAISFFIDAYKYAIEHYFAKQQPVGFSDKP